MSYPIQFPEKAGQVLVELEFPEEMQETEIIQFFEKMKENLQDDIEIVGVYKAA